MCSFMHLWQENTYEDVSVIAKLEGAQHFVCSFSEVLKTAVIYQ